MHFKTIRYDKNNNSKLFYISIDLNKPSIDSSEALEFEKKVRFAFLNVSYNIPISQYVRLMRSALEDIDYSRLSIGIHTELYASSSFSFVIEYNNNGEWNLKIEEKIYNCVLTFTYQTPGIITTKCEKQNKDLSNDVMVDAFPKYGSFFKSAMKMYTNFIEQV